LEGKKRVTRDKLYGAKLDSKGLAWRQKQPYQCERDLQGV